MSKARVGVVIIWKLNHRFFPTRGKLFFQEKAFFFRGRCSLSGTGKSNLPCPTLQITNQRQKRPSKGTCFLANSGNIVAIFGKTKKKGFKH